MTAVAGPEPLFIANHAALDFINTAFGTGAESREVLLDDRRVVEWLHAAGLLADPVAPPEGLAALARELRDAAGRLVRAPGTQSPADMALINRIREQGRPLSVLEWNASERRPVLVERRRDDGISSLLEPVATVVARLVSEGDLRRVRKCEAHDCTLLFEDATKSGRRRWCSMALCGNRMKVAAFRARRHDRDGGQ